MIVDPDFLDHWKTLMLVNSLGDPAAPLYVLRLWAHCQLRRQSEFENLPPEALKALCRFPGPANKLDSSLMASGFIRRDESILIVCNWDDYNSSLIAAWGNGRRGGRPKKTQTKPTGNQVKTHGLPSGNPAVTHGKPTENPDVTDKIGLDRIGLDRTKKEKEPRLSSEVTWPEELQTAEFADAWDLWKRHRLQKQKPLGSIEEESQLYDLARFGWQEAVQIVRYSISVGAKNLITNGDHAADKRARAPNQPRHRSRVPSLEEGSL